MRNIIFGYAFCDVEYEIAETYRPTDSVVRLQIVGAYLRDPSYPDDDDVPFKKSNDPHTLVVLGLLRVCRQIHAEVALVPYSLGFFEIIGGYFRSVEGQHRALNRFLKARTKEQLGVMARVVCEEWFDNGVFGKLTVETGTYWLARSAEASNEANFWGPLLVR